MIVVPIAASAPELRAALDAAAPPYDDLAEPGRAFVRFDDAGERISFGGLESCGNDVLLRSIVMLPEARGKGLSRRATSLLPEESCEAGARRAFLLTTDAKAFFKALGFRSVDPAHAPAGILATRQAASLCPSTAPLLALTL